MIDPGNRRFTMLDGMILVAASAVGFWLTKLIFPDVKWEDLPGTLGSMLLEGPPAGSSLRNWLDVIAELSLLIFPSVVIWTLAAPILRFRGPRPRWRRVWRQPGLIACASVLLTMLGLAVLGAAAVFGTSRVGLHPDADELFVCGSVACGLAVAVAWTILLLSRGWCDERSWIDRLGRVLGIAWIGYAALGVAMLM